MRRLATRQLVTFNTDAAHRTVLMLVADAPETPIQAEKCVMYLFELGANPKSTDGSGDTAAHLAARRDHLRLLTLAVVRCENRRGATPLMEAARTGSWRCAKHLLHLLRQKQFNECEKYGNSERERLLGLKDVDGRTALNLARLGDHSELASDIEREMRLVVTNEGYISGLTDQKATEAGHVWQLGRLATTGTQEGYDLPDKYGRTALMWAAGNSNCSDEYFCLHHAAWSGNSVAASALLHSGASVNAKDEQSVSPLMRATISASPSAATAVCRVLLDSGSDWSLEDQLGRTARDLARENGKAELEALLRGGRSREIRWLPVSAPGARHSPLCSWSLLDGEALERFIDNKPLDEQPCSFLQQADLQRALLYLHSRAAARDPTETSTASNIIVLADNTARIKLIDFGLSIKLEQIEIRSTSGRSAASRLQMGTGSRPPLPDDSNNLSSCWCESKEAEPRYSWNGGSVELKDFLQPVPTPRNRIERKPADELMKHQFFL
uniref:ANK_REP_REGION domain-containing protein n=1 Tax=Macrostomum lignano TaxID=282301 RepID=A0A1I8F5Z0_9PLAT